ncbi:hypothetical protein ACW7EJ_00670, partial [Acinetobacter soli]
TDLSTGKGYYSAGIGASTRKYIDPVVLFASVSANYGFKESDLNQRRGTRTINEFDALTSARERTSTERFCPSCATVTLEQPVSIIANTPGRNLRYRIATTPIS